jgi:serine O-acetyltransferase
MALLHKIIQKFFVKLNIYRIIFKFDKDWWQIKKRLKELKDVSLKRKYKLAYYLILEKRGCWIGHKSQFAGPPIVPHLFSIFISNHAKIGKNCTIFQHVTIGSNKLIDSRGKGAPTIGDNCYIGAGAKIIGKVNIGNNCRIGANCVVVKDMPDNAISVLQPCRTIVKKAKKPLDDSTP